MSEHEKEPWALSACNDIVAEDGFVILEGRAVLDGNLERIVACVNACAGLADPAAAIRELVGAARAIFQYETDGAPAFVEWDRYFDRLRAALAPWEPKP